MGLHDRVAATVHASEQLAKLVLSPLVDTRSHNQSVFAKRDANNSNVHAGKVSAPTPVSSPASPWLHPNWWTGHADNEQTLSFSAGAQGVTSDSHAGDVVEPPAMVGTTSDSSADATGGNVADVLADAYTADPVHTGPFAFHGGVDLF